MQQQSSTSVAPLTLDDPKVREEIALIMKANRPLGYLAAGFSMLSLYALGASSDLGLFLAIAPLLLSAYKTYGDVRTKFALSSYAEAQKLLKEYRRRESTLVGNPWVVFTVVMLLVLGAKYMGWDFPVRY